MTLSFNKTFDLNQEVSHLEAATFQESLTWPDGFMNCFCFWALKDEAETKSEQDSTAETYVRCLRW